MVGDAPLPPQEALRLLKEGNQRFARGEARAARGQNIHQDQGGESEAVELSLEHFSLNSSPPRGSKYGLHANCAAKQGIGLPHCLRIWQRTSKNMDSSAAFSKRCTINP